MQLFEALYFCKVLVQDRFKDHLTQLSEGVVIIVLADRKINVVARDCFLEKVDCDLQKPELFLVLVTMSYLLLQGVQAVEKLEELDDEVGTLFVDDEAVDGPGVESEPVGVVVH